MIELENEKISKLANWTPASKPASSRGANEFVC